MRELSSLDPLRRQEVTFTLLNYDQEDRQARFSVVPRLLLQADQRRLTKGSGPSFDPPGSFGSPANLDTKQC